MHSHVYVLTLQYDRLEEVSDIPIDSSAHEDPPRNMAVGIAVESITKIFNRRVISFNFKSLVHTLYH